MNARIFCKGESMPFEIKLAVDIDETANMVEAAKLILSNEEYIEEIYDALFEAIEENLSDIWWWKRNYKPQGYFNSEDMLTTHESESRTIMHNVVENIDVYIEITNEFGKVVHYGFADMKSILYRNIEEFIKGQLTDAEVCTATMAYRFEAQIGDFCRKSSWNFGLKKDGKLLYHTDSVDKLKQTMKKENEKVELIIWFGLKNEEPIDSWIIDSNTFAERIDFWFADDEDSRYEAIKKYLFEDYDPSYYWQVDDIVGWYFNELSGDTPNFEDIRRNCPINMIKTDTKEDIHQKFLNLMQ